MYSTQRTRSALASSLAPVLLLLALGGCDRATDGVSSRGTDSGATRVSGADGTPVRGAPDASTSAAPSGTAARDSTDADRTSVMGGSAGDKVDDAAITAQVNAKLARDKELNASRIDVDTQNGVVTLSGPTPSATAKEHAAEIAHRVKGVTSVNNQLTITSG